MDEQAIAAHIHGGAVGVNGNILFAFSALASPISLTATLTATQVSKVVAGLWYINVHTAENPNGEIRGQLLQVAPPSASPSVSPSASVAPSPLPRELLCSDGGVGLDDELRSGCVL